MRCARHPDVEADGICERCGDHVCRGCRHYLYPERCARCGDRLPRGIAWEDPRYGRLPWRFLLTVRDVLVRPAIAFPGPARVGPALAFAVACAGFAVPALAAASLWFVRGQPRAVGPAELLFGSLVVVGAAAGALVLTQTLTFAAGLVLVGRRHGVMRFGLRAACYASAVSWLALGALVGLNLSLGPSHVAQVGTLVIWAILAGRVFVHAARGLGLPVSSAVVAAIGPTLLSTVSVGLVVYEQLLERGVA